MQFVRKYWIELAAGALLAWWFFTGEGPVNIVRGFFGRGAKLTESHIRPDGSLEETPEQLQGQVVGALGRSVELDAVLMARVSASENPGANEREKAAIQWVLRNDAAAHGWTIRRAVTVNPGTLGRQAGRRYSTAGGGVGGVREIHEDDLTIAEDILAGALPDPTAGATKFIHYSGYARFRDWLDDNPKVAQWGGVPVDLGDVGRLVVFVPDGQPLPSGARRV